ncbi:MAG: fibronectin type III domain-containing protein [Bacteroidetes bacterium]|nr:fibronectin type III domain-containing protein [Bacteroidota bacterium]
MNMQLLILILTVYNAKNGLRNIAPMQLVERWRICIKAQTANAHFPFPNPTLLAQAAMCLRLEKAIQAAESGDRNKIAFRNEVFEEAKDMFRLMVFYVNNIAKGNREIIRSAGLEEKKGKGSSVLPGQVKKLKAVYHGVGKIKLLWKGMAKKEIYYHIEFTTDPVKGTWQKTKNGTKDDNYIVSDLVPGVEYFFRVRASNSLGGGDWSEVANFRCG